MTHKTLFVTILAAALILSALAGCSSSSSNDNSMPLITQTASVDGIHITISARSSAIIKYSIDDPNKFITYLGDIRLRSGIKHDIYAKWVFPGGEESAVAHIALDGLQLGTWDTSFSNNTGGYDANYSGWAIVPAPFMFNQIVSVPPPASGISTGWITKDPPNLPGNISTIQSTVSGSEQIFFPGYASNGAIGSKSWWRVASSSSSTYQDLALWAIDEYGYVYEVNMGSSMGVSPNFYSYKVLINGDMFPVYTGGSGGVLICQGMNPKDAVTTDSPIQIAASQGTLFVGILNPTGQYNVVYGSTYSECDNAFCLDYQTYSPPGCTGLAQTSLTAFNGNPYVGFLKSGALQVCSPALPNGGCVQVTDSAALLPFTLTHDWNGNLYAAYVASPASTTAVMMSADGGKTWGDISPSTDVMHGAGANFVAATTDNSGSLYVGASIAGQNNGVCTAQYSNGNWQTLNPGVCLPDPQTQQTSMSYDHITGLLFVSYLYDYTKTTCNLRIAKVAAPPPITPTVLDVYPTSLSAQESSGTGNCQATTQNINVYYPQGFVTVKGANSSVYVSNSNCTQACVQCTVQVTMAGGSSNTSLQLSDGHVSATVPVSFACNIPPMTVSPPQFMEQSDTSVGTCVMSPISLSNIYGPLTVLTPLSPSPLTLDCSQCTGPYPQSCNVSVTTAADTAGEFYFSDGYSNSDSVAFNCYAPNMSCPNAVQSVGSLTGAPCSVTVDVYNTWGTVLYTILPPITPVSTCTGAQAHCTLSWNQPCNTPNSFEFYDSGNALASPITVQTTCSEDTMSLSQTYFSGSSIDACNFPVTAYNTAEALSFMITSVTPNQSFYYPIELGNTCTGPSSSCSFTYQIPAGGSANVTVSDGHASIPTQMTCTQTP